VPPRNTAHRLRLPLLVSTAVLATVLAGCASGPADDDTTATPGSAVGDGHGAIAGAAEMPEPQPHLVTIDPAGAVRALDLLDESSTTVGTIDGVTSVSTDGRFLFAASAASGTVTVVDSGVWTWDHEDHFHYYRAEPRVVGTVEGSGEAVVSPGTTTTGVFFPDSGEAVLLDMQKLKDGDIVETASLDVDPHDGSITPVGDGALLTVAGADGTAEAVQAIDADGEAVGDPHPCVGARGAGATSVGVAIVCDDGALLAVTGDDGVSLEHLPLPEDAATPAAATPAGAESDAFANRRGRPVLATVAGDAGLWALDTRGREWTFVPIEEPLAQVVAVDDTEGHVVAVTDDGRVLVASAETGETLSVTEPILADSLADPELAAGVTLSVDRSRAYVNAPADGVVHEIDFADGARISRTFDLPAAPLFAVETGV
jgi:hypothetical protein